MPEYFIQFPANKVVPLPSEEDVSDNIKAGPRYGAYYLNPGKLTTSRMCVFTPIPVNSKLTRIRLVMRGKFSYAFSVDAFIKAQIVKNGKALPDGEVEFRSRADFPVVTRHMTSYPNLLFEKDDTIGIYITSCYVSNTHNTQYLSAILNFDDA